MSLYYRGDFLLHKLTPLTKMAVTLIAILHVVAFPQLNYVCMHLAAAAALLVIARPRVPLKVWASALAVAVGHGWINAVMAREGTPLLKMGGLSCTERGWS